MYVGVRVSDMCCQCCRSLLVGMCTHMYIHRLIYAYFQCVCFCVYTYMYVARYVCMYGWIGIFRICMHMYMYVNLHLGICTYFCDTVEQLAQKHHLLGLFLCPAPNTQAPTN